MVNTVSLLKRVPDLLLLHIELQRITPTIWRRFVVPEDITLGTLHQVVQVVMGWSDRHLHAFDIAGEQYGLRDPDDKVSSVTPEACTTLVNALMGNKAFDYRYDLGDRWDHRINVEQRLAAIIAPPRPHCIDGANTCPPEDVGGARSYETFRVLMADSEHSKHGDSVAWYGHVFEPAAFDCEQVNLRLKRIKA